MYPIEIDRDDIRGYCQSDKAFVFTWSGVARVVVGACMKDDILACAKDVEKLKALCLKIICENITPERILEAISRARESGVATGRSQVQDEIKKTIGYKTYEF